MEDNISCAIFGPPKANSETICFQELIGSWSQEALCKSAELGVYIIDPLRTKETGAFTFSSVQWLSRVRLFATPRTAVHQASLSITNCWSLLKLMSIKSVMQSNHLVLCCPLLFLHSISSSIRVLSKESALTLGGKSIGVSASESVLPMNTQDWFSLGSACWISLQSKGLRYAIIKIRAYYHSRNLVPRMI